jgi:hypothetical protein
MADHIIDPEIISRLKQQPIEEDGLILAVDYGSTTILMLTWMMSPG